MFPVIQYPEENSLRKGSESYGERKGRKTPFGTCSLGKVKTYCMESTTISGDTNIYEA